MLLSSMLISLWPDSTVYFRPEVDGSRYHGGANGFPGEGGNELLALGTDGSLATTVTVYAPAGSPSSRPVVTEYFPSEAMTP